MATQFDPIAKDESLNTTESPSRNIADVLAEELSAIEQAIAGGSGSGGHVIENASGTDMTQRAKMQFVDAEVTDDAVNDVTKISTTPASYPSANVTYGSGSVEDRLDMVSGGVTFPPTAYITTAGGSATASKDGFAGGTFIQSSGDNRAAWITVNGNQVAYIGGASYSDMPMIFLYYVHAGDVIETRSGVGKYHILVP